MFACGAIRLVIHDVDAATIVLCDKIDRSLDRRLAEEYRECLLDVENLIRCERLDGAFGGIGDIGESQHYRTERRTDRDWSRIDPCAARKLERKMRERASACR